MIEKLKELRRNIAKHDITFWELFPILPVIMLPSIFEPEWLWRLLAFFFAGVIIIVICVHALLVPEQFKFPNLKKQLTKKVFFWVIYTATIFGIPFIIYFSLFPSSTDLYQVVKNPKTALQSKTIEVTKWGGGGTVAPFFIGQTLATSDESYFLPFSFQAWGAGMFEILYSPKTKIIYEIKKLQ